MKGILQDVQLLVGHQVMKLATERRLQELEDAIENVSANPPSPPVDGATSSVNNHGPGPHLSNRQFTSNPLLTKPGNPATLACCLRLPAANNRGNEATRLRAEKEGAAATLIQRPFSRRDLANSSPPRSLLPVSPFRGP